MAFVCYRVTSFTAVNLQRLPLLLIVLHLTGHFLHSFFQPVVTKINSLFRPKWLENDSADMCCEGLPFQFPVLPFLSLSQNLDILLQVFDALLSFSFFSRKFTQLRGQTFLTVFRILSVAWREKRIHLFINFQ